MIMYPNMIEEKFATLRSMRLKEFLRCLALSKPLNQFNNKKDGNDERVKVVHVTETTTWMHIHVDAKTLQTIAKKAGVADNLLKSMPEDNFNLASAQFKLAFNTCQEEPAYHGVHFYINEQDFSSYSDNTYDYLTSLIQGNAEQIEYFSFFIDKFHNWLLLADCLRNQKILHPISFEIYLDNLDKLTDLSNFFYHWLGVEAV